LIAAAQSGNLMLLDQLWYWAKGLLTPDELETMSPFKGTILRKMLEPW
jgi:hypothetical protein